MGKRFVWFTNCCYKFWCFLCSFHECLLSNIWFINNLRVVIQFLNYTLFIIYDKRLPPHTRNTRGVITAGLWGMKRGIRWGMRKVIGKEIGKDLDRRYPIALGERWKTAQALFHTDLLWGRGNTPVESALLASVKWLNSFYQNCCAKFK